ncbi:MAG: amino acid permease [Mycoplasmatales bacterium]|nr:amino acid permease [Mycoplasmatales bacterium]
MKIKNFFSKNKKNLSLGSIAIALLIFNVVAGFNGATNGLIKYGNFSIILWIVAAVVIMIPFSIVLIELSGVKTKENKDSKKNGIFKWTSTVTNKKIAFLVSWTYYMTYLLILLAIYTSVPVSVSYLIFGENRLNGDYKWLASFLAIIMGIIYFFISQFGVSKLKGISSSLTIAALSLIALFIFVGVVGAIAGENYGSFNDGIGSEHIWKSDKNTFDNFVSLLSGFAWLLFSLAGMEAITTYIGKSKNNSSFRKGAIIAVALITSFFIITTIVIISSTNIKNIGGVATAPYEVWRNSWGIDHEAFVRIYAGLETLRKIIAYSVLTEFSAKILVESTPKELLPSVFFKKNKYGGFYVMGIINLSIVIAYYTFSMINTLTFESSSVDSILSSLMNAVSIGVILAYGLTAISQIILRLKNYKTDNIMIKNKYLSILISSFFLFFISLVLFSVIYNPIVSAINRDADWLLGIVTTIVLPFLIISFGMFLYLLNIRKKNISKDYYEPIVNNE